MAPTDQLINQGHGRALPLRCRWYDQNIEALAGADIAPGAPDGAVVDRDGCCWSAWVWGGCLARIDPHGRLLERIDLPTKGLTCVALVGHNGRDLFATTLRIRHTDEELRAMPQAGGLFSVRVDVPGQEARLCHL